MINLQKRNVRPGIRPRTDQGPRALQGRPRSTKLARGRTSRGPVSAAVAAASGSNHRLTSGDMRRVLTRGAVRRGIQGGMPSWSQRVVLARPRREAGSEANVGRGKREAGSPSKSTRGHGALARVLKSIRTQGGCPRRSSPPFFLFSEVFPI